MLDYGSEKTYSKTRLPLTLASTLLPQAYKDGRFFEAELRRVWNKSWICVGYTQQLRELGDAIVVRIFGQSIIIVRSDSSTIRAFYNVCRHRGAEICEGDGKYQVFRCPYHSWGYALDGHLKGAPYFPEGELKPEEEAIFDTSGVQGFQKIDYPLLPVQVAVWGCFVFINLDSGGPSLTEQLGDLSERVDHYPLKQLEWSRSVHYEISANWKLIAENFMEYYHLPSVHPALNRVSNIGNHIPFQGPGMYYGMSTILQNQDPTVAADRQLPMMPGLNAGEKNSARWVWLFPNLSISLLPDHAIFMLLFPEEPGKTRERYDFFLHPNVREANDFEGKVQQLYQFWDTVNREDIRIVEAVQRGISADAYEGGRMCFRFEDNVYRFQNHVIDKMVDGADPARVSAAPSNGCSARQ